MQNRGFTFLVLGLLFSFSILSFVSAQDPFAQFFGDGADSIFSQWAGAEFNANFTKILLTIIVGLLVYAVADKLPGFTGEGMFIARLLLSIIVAILATWFIAPNELYAILTSYSALGFALSAILPFLIIGYWSFSIISDTRNLNPSVAKWLSNGVWILFITFLLYRIWVIMPALPTPPSGWQYWVSYLFVLAGLIWIFASGRIQHRVLKEKMQGQETRLSELTQKAALMESYQAEMLDKMTGPRKK